MLKTPAEIRRYPYRKDDPLQGHDSADELLLQHVSTLPLEGKRILIVGDQFGALSCGLYGNDLTTYTDSYVSAMGIRRNSDEKILPLSRLQDLEGPYDYALIKIPKNMSYFEDLLCTLTQVLHPKGKVICGGMVKHMSPTSFDLLNRLIGPTTTSLAQKKARLIFAEFQGSRVPSPWPQEIRLDGFDRPFTHHSNLFSREKLDIGTRFFLEHLPQGDFSSILDLGCANGVIGIRARELNPTAKILFSDESQMAIQSAEVNYRKHFSDEARFIWTNCFEDQAPGTLDLVLCNPPFHQQSTVGDFIAWQMFKDAHHALKTGGRIRIIGNSHLGHQGKLKKIFGNFKIVATNQKFLIAEAAKGPSR